MPLQDVTSALERLRRERYRDQRVTVFNVRAEETPAGFRLTGEVLTPEQREAARSAAAGPASDDIRVLLASAPYALVNRNVTDLRREPDRLKERVSQALLGEAARILDQTPTQGWVRVQMEQGGYIGWLHDADLYRCAEADGKAYHSRVAALVQVGLAEMHAAPRADGSPLGLLPFGVPLPVAERRDGFACVRLPDGRTAWVAEKDLLPIARRPQPDADGIALTLDRVRHFLTVPYVWGGRSPFGFDCSGFAGAFWGFMGVELLRDADQQFAEGEAIHGTPQPGDLLFFGGDDDPHHRNITHVAISLGGDEVIHANGSANGVSYNSLNPNSPIYRQWLREHLAGVRRYA